MPHDISRVLRAFAARPWFIEGGKAREIVAMLELRAAFGPRETPYRDSCPVRPPVTLAFASLSSLGRAASPGVLAFDDETGDQRRARLSARETPVGQERQKRIALLTLYGAIVPRMERVADVSATAASLVDFQHAFQSVANDPDVAAIILDVDSPGGTVDLVPETAAMIRAARREDRPIVAVANTMAASAAYWIYSAADELVVTPSGMVGSIGVYLAHEDISEAMKAEGVNVTLISEGPRKVEGHPFAPLDDVARAALQSEVRAFYEMFTSDIAKNRGVAVSLVRADPEKTEESFGGGRVLNAKQAVAVGAADRIGTLDSVIREVAAQVSSGGAKRKARSSAVARRRLALT